MAAIVRFIVEMAGYEKALARLADQRDPWCLPAMLPWPSRLDIPEGWVECQTPELYETFVAALKDLGETPKSIAEEQAEPIRCESCGAKIRGDPDEDFCAGCHRHICYTCVVVWDHLGKGAHGTGDPAAEIERLKEMAAQAVELVDQINQADNALKVVRDTLVERLRGSHR